MAARVAIAGDPPLLADLLRRLFEKAGIELAEAGTAPDIAVLLEGDVHLAADITITVDSSHASIRDRDGVTTRRRVSGPTELIDIVRSVTGGRVGG